MKQNNIATNLKEFIEQYTDHYLWTRSFIEKLVDDTYIAEDFASETTTKLWKEIIKGTTINNIQAYLKVTARNRCFDHFKKTKVFREKRKMYEWHMADETDNSILDNIETKDRLKIINAEIEKLPPALKHVLISQMDGIKYQQIAEELNISVKSVNQYLWRARKKIRANLLKKGSFIGNKQWRIILNILQYEKNKNSKFNA
jgi:RNA polymerase sigma-70 factor (ECF subfamily)